MLKNSIIEKTAVDLNQDKELIYKVINSSFEELVKAVKVYNSVEISGFGTLKLSPTKILKRLPGFKYVADFFEKRYIENPNPDDFKKMNDTKQDLDNLKYRYEQIKGKPPIILERGKKL